MLYPLTFHPIYKERVWGGRNLERLYAKNLPPGQSIGESWEIADRPDAVSVVANGPLAGKDLHWLLEHHAVELLGAVKSQGQRFPLLIKILDAEEKLSLQVHPPAAIATALGGQPKTELWYIADARPGAELFVGLRRGVTREEFEQRIRDGTVADCFHRVPVNQGDAMFLPSGRVHAIGAGIVIFEIQQNSDTTYRVFDWNRAGLNGKPRELHVSQSLQCIDFGDFEPGLVSKESRIEGDGSVESRVLADNSLFAVRHVQISGGDRWAVESDKPEIIGVVHGKAHVDSEGGRVDLRGGGFCLKPAGTRRLFLHFKPPVGFLRIEAA